MLNKLRQLLLVLCLFAGPAGADGTLVIVGGGLESGNADVFKAFVEALDGDGQVVIIPAASAAPAGSAAGFSAELERHGVSAERVTRFPLAVLDDESTPDVDESTWRENAWDVARVAALGEPAGFWFTGGDQIRIMETISRDQSEASPLLVLIRERLAAGAVVGGTSAGAAIMSHHMIAGGHGPAALLEPVVRDYRSDAEVEEGRLLMTAGTGFFPAGIVDQHFVSRPRLGRLVRALGETGECYGYGVSENTAMVVDLDGMTVTVLGTGVVVLVDVTNAGFEPGSTIPAKGVSISYAASGARFPLRDCALE